MLLSLKRYIGRNTVVEWALFHLQMQIHSRSDLLFNISSFSKNNMKKDFDKLKKLLSIPPKQRSPQILRQIQLCLKKNRAFQSLRDKTQLELCQHIVYQVYETNTLVIKQGHVPCECYIILSGSLNAITEEKKPSKHTVSSNILYEVEEGDFLGDIGLVTNKRQVSFVCKSDVELLAIEKEAFNGILAAKVLEQYSSLRDFLRSMPLFSSWTSEKIDLLVHCSLQRNYRAGATVIVDSTKSSFMVLVKSGRCLIVAQLTRDRPRPATGSSINYCSLLERFPTMPFLLEKKDCTFPAFQRPTLSRTSYSASCRPVSTQMHRRPRPQTAGPSTFSLRDTKEHCDFDRKGNKSKEKNRCVLFQSASISPTCFITVGTLEQGGIFGISEMFTRSSELGFSLLSEGAECIFISKKLFLAEAPAKSRHVAQELVNSFPTENKIRACYTRHQTWSAYKDKVIGQQLTRDMK
ncbi:cyclic nucleotide-binding domain-containing protein 2-like [Pelodytes ibericus]